MLERVASLGLWHPSHKAKRIGAPSRIRTYDTRFRNSLVVSALTRGIAADRWWRARYAPYTMSHND